jgi:CBS domain-containing protein
METLVSDLMTTDVMVVRNNLDVHELEQLFLNKGIHGAPVVDENDRLVGVVSQTDLLAWHYQSGHDAAGFYEHVDLRGTERLRGLFLSDIRTASVSEVMTPLVHAVRRDNTATEAAVRMIRHKIHRLVVVDANLRVQGILSAMDLLRLIPGVADALSRRG